MLENNIKKNFYFKWYQLIHALTKSWKKDLIKVTGTIEILFILMTI